MKTSYLLMLAGALTLGACGDTKQERATSGALIGAGAGAATGAIVAGDPAAGAVVGGLIGAGAGAAVGSASDHPWFDR